MACTVASVAAVDGLGVRCAIAADYDVVIVCQCCDMPLRPGGFHGEDREFGKKKFKNMRDD